MRTLVWFRGKDLRLADHAPLCDALDGGEVVLLFVLDPYFFAPERAANIPYRMQFLLDSLAALEADVRLLGGKLFVARGKSVEVVPELARRFRVDRVVAQRWTEPFGRERDRRVQAALDVPFVLFEGETLHPPGSLRSRNGGPYAVFTPFSRAFAAEAHIGEPLAAPVRLPPPPSDVRFESASIPRLDELGLRCNTALLPGGESAARRRLEWFIDGPAREYDKLRDRLDLEGTSRLSVDLKFGTLSPRTLWREVEKALVNAPSALHAFQNELVWREFTHSTLWDRPELLREPYRSAWRDFPWQEDEAGWGAWCNGTTGYPIVDAAQRELVAEGFVPNRARMIAASFLTKQLLIDYRRGEAHYLRWLTDGDWAQNNAGWQWSAGSGMDAQPYFRIFNPVTQGERYDPEGAWVRRWVPELGRLPSKYIHAPFRSPPSVLEAAGVRLGETYPEPIIDLDVARARFLAVAESYLRAPPSEPS